MSILCACIGILSAMCVAGAMSWWRNPQEEEEEGGREEKQEEGQKEERLNINKSPDSKDVRNVQWQNKLQTIYQPMPRKDKRLAKHNMPRASMFSHTTCIWRVCQRRRELLWRTQIMCWKLFFLECGTLAETTITKR